MVYTQGNARSYQQGPHLIRRQRTISVDPTPLPPGSEYASTPCFLRTTKGALKLCDGEGFRFIRNRVDGIKTYWNCEKKKNECKARAISLADVSDVVFNDMAHNHAPPHRVWRKDNDDYYVQPGGPGMPHPGILTPASPPVPILHKASSPPPQMAKKVAIPPPAVQPIQRASAGKEIKIAPKPAAPVKTVAPPSPEVCLRWNSYHSNMQNTFPSLLNNEQFVDVTLACDGRSIKCHKVMLSACSPYMEELLSANPCQHPIIFLKDMKFWQLAALVDFMYRGEVNVTQDKLPSLLAAAEALQIKGLASPVHPTSPSRLQQQELTDQSDSNISLLRQFESEIKTEGDDDYLLETDDDSLPASTPQQPKKRKLNDTPHIGQMNGKKPRERHSEPNMQHRQQTQSTPTHMIMTPDLPMLHSHRQSSMTSNMSQDRSQTDHDADDSYQAYSMDCKTGNEDIDIDEEQGQMILERYTKQEENYAVEPDDGSTESG